MTTVDTITESQLSALRNEAEEAGDFEMAEVANLALADLERPWEGTAYLEECVQVIRHAEAQS